MTPKQRNAADSVRAGQTDRRKVRAVPRHRPPIDVPRRDPAPSEVPGEPPAHGDAELARFWPLVPTVFLVSFAVLTFEVALTRVFSVMVSYHFVFAIVSASLLGLGVGAGLLKRWRRLIPSGAVHVSALVFALLVAGSTLGIVLLPIPDGAASTAGLLVYLILAALPFCAAGLTISGIFQEFPGKASILYGADLLGAGLAALGVVFLLDATSAPNVVLLAAAAAALGAAAAGWSQGRVPVAALASLLVLAGAFAAMTLTGLQVPLTIANDPNKDMYRLLSNPSAKARIVDSRWSSFGRTDLVATALLPNEMTLFVDGAAGSAMYDLEAIMRNPEELAHITLHFGGYFPFMSLRDDQRDSALIIGPGGGRDVIVALAGGVKSITAVEVNPDVVRLVRKYASFNGGIYTGAAGIDVRVAEGRDFVRRSNQRFDNVMLSIPVTKSSRSVEGYALTENYLFTVEAFADYLDHLTPEGRIIIVAHDDAEIYRLISLAVTALNKRGVPDSEALKHVYTVAPPMMPAVVIQNRPFTAAEAAAIHPRIRDLGYDQGNFFVPYIKPAPVRAGERLEVDAHWRMFDRLLVDVSEGRRSLKDLVRAASADISAVTDDRPFFYKVERGLPRPFRAFAVLLIGAAGLLVVLVARRRRPEAGTATLAQALSSARGPRAFLLLFSLLGVGFMTVEIALFQKLMLYLGQPQRSLSVLLFSLLIGGGIGSLASTAVRSHLERALAIACGSAAVLILLVSLSLPLAFGLAIDSRASAMLLLIPLGTAMGFPFPLAIRSANASVVAPHVHLMWAVNGIASVLGSALAMMVGISIGFSFSIGLGLLLYVGAAGTGFVISGLSRTNRSWSRTARPARGQNRRADRIATRSEHA